MDCRSCLSGLDHCHGTLVVHEIGDVDCTETCADLDPVRHRLQLNCADIDGGCPCTVGEVSELVRAS
jgi:hypothetical protein